MTTCEELIRFLGDYLAEELPSEQKTRFEKHLEDCPSCRAYLSSYRTTITLARTTAQPAEIEDVPPEVLTAILATIAEKPTE